MNDPTISADNTTGMEVDLRRLRELDPAPRGWLGTRWVQSHRWGAARAAPMTLSLTIKK